MVEQAVKKICQEGNIDNMEKILGLSSQMIVGSEEEFLMTESNDIVPNTDIGEQQNDLVKSEHKATEDPLDNSEYLQGSEQTIKKELHAENELVFKDVNNIRKVKRNVEKGSHFFCDICGKTMPGSWDLRRHKIRNHSKQRKCKVCGEEFYELEAWSLHLKACFYTCVECDFRDKRLSRYEAHQRRHTREKYSNKEDKSYTQRITVIYK